MNENIEPTEPVPDTPTETVQSQPDGRAARREQERNQYRVPLDVLNAGRHRQGNRLHRRALERLSEAAEGTAAIDFYDWADQTVAGRSEVTNTEVETIQVSMADGLGNDVVTRKRITLTDPVTGIEVVFGCRDVRPSPAELLAANRVLASRILREEAKAAGDALTEQENADKAARRAGTDVNEDAEGRLDHDTVNAAITFSVRVNDRVTRKYGAK